MASSTGEMAASDFHIFRSTPSSESDVRAIQSSSGQEVITYRALHERFSRLARSLQQAYQVRKGDRVAILARNGIVHFSFLGATARIGAVLVPLNYRLGPAELARVLRDCDPSVIFYSAEFGKTLEGPKDVSARKVRLDEEALLRQPMPASSAGEDVAAPEITDEPTPAMILYTSGTTGDPKGVIVTPEMLRQYAVSAVERYRLTSDDTALISIPLYHTGGWNVAALPLLQVGGRLVVADRFDPVEHLRTIERERITVFPAVPTMLQRMSESEAFAAADLSSLRCVILGGEAAPPELAATWMERGADVWQNFGMTEAGPGIFSLPPGDALLKPGSAGLPAPHVHVRIVHGAGEDVPEGEPGELLVSGPSLTPGYWNDPAATAAAIRDGWLRTGDYLWRDGDGYYHVAGRKNEMYVSGGENVFPAEVERALAQHPDVAAVAVVPVPDERWGETGAAFIVPARSERLDPDSVTAFLSDHLARYKIPRRIYFVESLPVNATGKVDRMSLKEVAAARSSKQ